MKVLVLGAAGHTGNALAREFLRQSPERNYIERPLAKPDELPDNTLIKRLAGGMNRYRRPLDQTLRDTLGMVDNEVPKL